MMMLPRIVSPRFLLSLVSSLISLVVLLWMDFGHVPQSARARWPSIAFACYTFCMYERRNVADNRSLKILPLASIQFILYDITATRTPRTSFSHFSSYFFFCFLAFRLARS